MIFIIGSSNSEIIFLNSSIPPEKGNDLTFKLGLIATKLPSIFDSVFFL